MASENTYTYCDHSKPKKNYAQEKRANPQLVAEAEHAELCYFQDNQCTKEHIGPLPKGAEVTYYNPQLEYKLDKDGKLIVKIRGIVEILAGSIFIFYLYTSVVGLY